MSKYILQLFGSFHSIICMQLKVHLEILKRKDILMVDRSSNVLPNGVFIESKTELSTGQVVLVPWRPVLPCSVGPDAFFIFVLSCRQPRRK